MAFAPARASVISYADRFIDELAELEALVGRADAVIPAGITFRDWCLELGRMGLKVDGKPFTLEKRYALEFVYDQIPSTAEQARKATLVVMKGAQVGLTVWEMLANIYLSLRLYPCTVGAYVPDRTLAAYKSTERFMPILRLVPTAYAMLRETVSSAYRTGEGNVLTRSIGASKVLFLWTSGKVTTESYPMDVMAFDEVQEMDLADIEKAEERMSASAIKFKMLLSTAKYPGEDIDYWYQRGSEHHFHTACDCPDGVVLDMVFLDADNTIQCIVFNDGAYDAQGAPRDYIYRCPKCNAHIPDSQVPKLVNGVPIGDKGWVATNPAAPYISVHYPQTLSATVTPREMYESYVSATNLENFFQRKLGRPWVDPSKVPITAEILQKCVEEGARAGIRWKAGSAGSYMGIDQMGGFNFVIIKERLPDGRQALIHAEAIFGPDPFMSCDKLMKRYRVQVCVVENLPNFNDAMRFAQRHKGRVFVADYGAVEGEAIAWRDQNMGDGKRKTSADERLRYTVAIDQYRCMQISMARMIKQALLFPDPKALQQEYREKNERKRVALLQDIIFNHFQKTALVTERVDKDGDERRLRKRVLKVGIDPHASYANMLCDVAWARAHGTSSFILPDTTPEKREAPVSPKDVVQTSPLAVLKHAQEGLKQIPAGEVCGRCTAFDKEKSFCRERFLTVAAKDPGCLVFDEVQPIDDDDDPASEQLTGKKK